MKKKIGTVLMGSALTLSLLFPSASLAASTYKVVPGDTLEGRCKDNDGNR